MKPTSPIARTTWTADRAGLTGRRRGHVFISYVREDSSAIDRLEQALRDAGIPVWRDVTDIGLGLDWRREIDQAITQHALVFLACFSHASVARHRTEQRTELLLAAEEYRRRRPDRAWLIPIRLSDCDLPHVDLGAGRSLTSLNWLDLFGDRWDPACARLISEIRRQLDPASTARPGDQSTSPRDPGAAAEHGPSRAPMITHRSFWARYLDRARSRHPDWHLGATAPRENYIYQRCPIDTCRIAPGFKRDGRLSHELVIMSPDAERNLQTFTWLRDQRASVEGAYGRPLTWDEHPQAKRCLVGEYRSGSIDDHDRHDDYIDWFIDCGRRLRRALNDLPT